MFEKDRPDPFRIGARPFPLSQDDLSFFHALGRHLLAFYRAINKLYLDSVRGHAPEWVHRYLDQGKPESLIAFARMNRFRDLLPDVIRPDIIPTDTGMVITELDSVPGGIGLTGSLSAAYARFGEPLVGGAHGIVNGFAAMCRARLESRTPTVAIVVSDESESYRPEMHWLAHRLNESGLQAACVHPKALRFTDDGVWLPARFGDQPVSLVYRFFELFDLPNIPKSELLQYCAKKALTCVTPPYKPWLEEKAAFAFLHHPVLERYWEKALGLGTFTLLRQLTPRTWILDPQPLPPIAVIPGLSCGGQPVTDWRDLEQATQKERRLVVKPSGFSPLAWGSRGVAMGHDLSQADWSRVIDNALRAFPTTPHILQTFHKGRQVTMEYIDGSTNELRRMEGRVRLCPYYFVHRDDATLAGILATICPKEKKILHGMRDAIMVPCAVPEAAPDHRTDGSGESAPC